MAIGVLVGIPCFNESLTISGLCKEIMSLSSSEFVFRVVVVDDGSTDATFEKSIEIGAEVIRHGTNRGLGSVFESFREFALSSSEDLFVIIDGDGQFSPSQILDLVAPLTGSQADLVIGSRFTGSKPRTQPWRNYLGNRLVNMLVSVVVRSRYTDVSSGFRSYSRKSLTLLRNMNQFNFSQHTFLLALNLDLIVKEVPVSVEYFSQRKTRMASSFTRQSFLIGRNLFGSIKQLYPLHFYSFLSLLCYVPSLFLATLFILHFLRNGQFTGYLFAGFTSAFLFVIGLILFSIGLISNSLSEIRKDQHRIIARMDNKKRG